MKRLLAILGILDALHAHAAGRQCSDFLKDLGLARPDVTFTTCVRREERSPAIDRLEATYHVAGKDLAGVEAWLAGTFNMKPLRFLCCGWEAPPVSFKTRDGSYYEISFGGETFLNDRKDWPRVPYMVLSVTYGNQEP